MSDKTNKLDDDIKPPTPKTDPDPAPRNKPEAEGDFVVFESTGAEIHYFDIGRFSPYRADNDRLRWDIPKDKADRYEQHHFVQNDRVRRLR